MYMYEIGTVNEVLFIWIHLLYNIQCSPLNEKKKKNKRPSRCRSWWIEEKKEKRKKQTD